MNDKLKRLFAKVSPFLLMIAIGFLIVFFSSRIGITVYFHDGSLVLPSEARLDEISFASADSSGNVALYDETSAVPVIASVDTTSGRTRYVVNKDQLPEFESVNFDIFDMAAADDGSLYLLCCDWSNTTDTIDREYIIRIDPDGKYDGKVWNADYFSEEFNDQTALREPHIRELNFYDGKLGFAYCGGTRAYLYEIDCSTRDANRDRDIVEETGRALEIISCGGGEYLCLCSDGSVYKTAFGRELGEPIFRYTLDPNDGEYSDMIVGAAGLDGKLYVASSDDISRVYELKDGGLSPVTAPDDGTITALELYAGKLMVIKDEALFTLENGSLEKLGPSVKMPSECVAVSWAQIIGKLIMILGAVGAAGWLIVKRKTLLTKLLLLIIPTLTVISAGMFVAVFSRLTDQVRRDMRSEITAVCELSSMSLDGLDLSLLNNNEDFDDEYYFALCDGLSALCNNNMSSWGMAYNMRILIPAAENSARVLAASDYYSLPNEYLVDFETEEDIEENLTDGSYRVSLFEETPSLFNTHDDESLTAYGRIYDEDGEVCAYLSVAAQSYNISVSRQELMFDVMVYALMILIVLTVIMTVLSLRISSLVRSTTETVSKIADGDFSARTNRIPNDEFGDICSRVNSMAQSLETMFNEKDKNERFYYKFVPEKFRELLGKDKLTDLALGDAQSREFSVLFCDIRSFSLNSEMMTAKENFEFVNVIYGIAGPIIREHGGFVDKYIGDAVMALFESADMAVKAGIELYRKIVLDPQTAEKLNVSTINIGIGIHTGMVEIGIVGEEERLSGTVISDAVNLSSRLESLTKTYKTAMIISKDTLDRMDQPEALNTRYLGMVQVAGVNEIRSLYEVLDCLSDEEKALRGSSSANFREALRLFHMGDKKAAAERFKSIIDKGCGDHVAQMYLDYISELPPDDKSSVFRFMKK